MTIALLFLLGLCIGSFLNVVIDRVPKDKTILRGRSYCDHCKKDIAWRDLIPVVSFIMLGGKCRNCKKQIDIRNPTVEITTGLLFVLIYFSSLPLNYFSFFVLIFVFSSLIAIFFIDLKDGIIPDKITYPAIFVLVVYLLTNTTLLMNHLLSALLASAFFLIIFILTRGRGLGFGDVKLAGLLGIFLGFPNVFLAIYIAFLTGATVSFILILWRKKVLKDTVPFGPFLILGAVISFFWGERMASHLLSFL